MKRIYSIDLFKLLFAYIVALGHFGVTVAPGTNVTVQMFFIISGFFLARKFYAVSAKQGTREYNQWNYTLDHVKSLYPHYLFSLVIFAISKMVKIALPLLNNFTWSGIGELGKLLYALIPEMLLVQNTGFFEGGINYPLWQVCVLVIGGYFVYGALCIHEKRSRMIVFPAAILMIQTLLYSGVGLWETVGFFYVPLLRAISPMCIGVLTYYLTTTEYYGKIKSHSLLFNAGAVLSLIAIFVFGGYGNVFLITFPIVLLAMYEESSWINCVFNRKLFARFGTFSYAIYLNHAVIIHLMKDMCFPAAESLLDRDIPSALETVIYLVAVTVYSVVTLCIVNKLMSRRAAKKQASMAENKPSEY